MRAHTHSNYGHLGNASSSSNLSCTNLLSGGLQDLECLVVIQVTHSKGKVCGVILSHVLHNHIDINIGRTNRSQYFKSNAWGVRHTTNGELGFVTVKGNTRNNRLFHGVLILISADLSAN